MGFPWAFPQNAKESHGCQTAPKGDAKNLDALMLVKCTETALILQWKCSDLFLFCTRGRGESVDRLSRRPQVIETAMIARDSAGITPRDDSDEPLPFEVATTV